MRKCYATEASHTIHEADLQWKIHASPHFETFPDTPMGVKDASEFLKSSVQYLSGRDFCDSCLQQERPKKRIRLQSCNVCGECLLKRALA